MRYAAVPTPVTSIALPVLLLFTDGCAMATTPPPSKATPPRPSQIDVLAQLGRSFAASAAALTQAAKRCKARPSGVVAATFCRRLQRELEQLSELADRVRALCREVAAHHDLRPQLYALCRDGPSEPGRRIMVITPAP